MSDKGLKRGQPITFRIPSDTSDHTLKYLQKLKETERRNFSSKIAELVINGLHDSMIKQREVITIPLPKSLDKAQRDWLKHEHSEALLGSIVYQLLEDPIRTAALYASINNNGIAIDDMLDDYKEMGAAVDEVPHHRQEIAEQVETDEEPLGLQTDDDDLDNFDWNTAIKVDAEPELEEDLEDDPLGDFLAQMNK